MGVDSSSQSLMSQAHTPGQTCLVAQMVSTTLNTNENNYLNTADSYKLKMVVTMETNEWWESEQGNVII